MSKETRTEADMAKRYDTLRLRLPKGSGQKLEDLRRESGMSKSQYVARMIEAEWDAEFEAVLG